MYRVIAYDGSHVTNAEHLETALSLMRRIPRAAQVWDADGLVMLAFKPRGSSLLALVGFGEHAGAPRGTDAAWCAGMN